jgi:CDP-diacylglycerol--glycerol-3-phosphate 3-phosphatidyltransferase
MISYTRARAESLGLTAEVGLLPRPERVIILALGLILGWAVFALALLAILTNFTAIQRIVHVWRKTRRER